MRIKDLPKKSQQAINGIVASMSIEERSLWDEMRTEDEEMMIQCLVVQAQNGGVFDLQGIRAHFRVSKLLLEASEAS